MFDEVHILFHFNIILKHNGMSSIKNALMWLQRRVEGPAVVIMILQTGGL